MDFNIEHLKDKIVDRINGAGGMFVFNYPDYSTMSPVELYYYDGTAQSHSADVISPRFFSATPDDLKQRGTPRFRCPGRSKIMEASGRRPRSEGIPSPLGDRDVKNPISPIESKSNVTRRTSLRKKKKSSV